MTQPRFDVKGKVAIITGGTGVLGGSMAKSLATAGAKIVVVGRRSVEAEKLAAHINKERGEAIGIAADVLIEEQLIAVKDKTLNLWGRIDILINGAGGNMPGATIAADQTIFDLSMNDFGKVAELNLQGSVLPSLVFGKVMADQASGVIINISSMTVSQAVTRVVGYSASKAAVENFTRWLAVEMATKFGEGIRVNAIAPGFFIGEQNRDLLINPDGSYTDRGKSIIKKTPMKRFGEPEELNGVVQWLCSDAATFVTGAVIPLDGGFSAFSGV